MEQESTQIPTNIDNYSNGFWPKELKSIAKVLPVLLWKLITLVEP